MKTIKIMLILGGFLLFVGISNVYSQVSTEEAETVVEPAVTPPAPEKPNMTKSEPVPGAEVYTEEGTSGLAPAVEPPAPEKPNTKVNATGKKEEEVKPETK